MIDINGSPITVNTNPTYIDIRLPGAKESWLTIKVHGDVTIRTRDGKISMRLNP